MRLNVDEFFLLSHGQGYTAGSDDRRTPPINPTAVLPALKDAHNAVTTAHAALPSTLEELARMVERGGLQAPPGAEWLTDPPTELLVDRGGIEPANIWEWVPRQRDMCKDDWAYLDGADALAPGGGPRPDTARHLAHRLAVLKDQLVPASFWWLWSILFALLVFSAIVPLTYLSARSGCSKAILMLAFSVLSLAFFGFLAYELRRLRHAADLTRDTF